ncbi:MAG: outer membrane beta-barrel protein [Algicola sp.]|nr:outer membrane beta-barrel protein [Algicola sp.]
MGKKNLEQLFKEQFRDFQEVPDPKVWNAIENSLDNKKQKKRIVPIWWYLGGVAAALVIVLLVINPVTDEPIEQQIITDVENTSPPADAEKDADSFNKTSLSPETDLTLDNEVLAETGNSTKTSNSESSINKTKVSSTSLSPSTKNNLATADNKSENNLTPSESQFSKNSKKVSESNTVLASNKPDSEPTDKQSISTTSNLEEAVALNEEKKNEVEKQSIYDAIKEQEDLGLDEAIANNNSGKWSVGPSLAPVYFDASGDGSPIGPDFSSNSKSGNLNLSYGLTVAYEMGKKLKIRSGVHRVNYGYSTNDVLFSSTLRAAATDKIANIDYSPNPTNIIVESRDANKASPSVTSKEIAENSVPALDGKMVQQLGYIEVPLEVNYAVLDKKFGVDLIGGFSSLFLVDNSVLLESNDLVTEVGKANNINSLNFSANVGMGLNYKFSPKIKINVEPVFKYQLNTFSNVSGNFQPYSIGVYSGFSFKF